MVRLLPVLLTMLSLAGLFPVTAVQAEEGGDPGGVSQEQVIEPVIEGLWFTENPLPASRVGAATGVINGTLYVAGGLYGTETATLYAYNPALDTWNLLAPMPQGRYQGNGAGVIDGKLYVVGGWDNTYSYLPHSDLFVYDPATDQWNSRTSMPILSAYGATSVIDDKLYVTTAADGYSGFRNFLHVYDPSTDSWLELAPSPISHSSPGYGVIDGKFYVVGGYNGTVNTGQLDVYDPATDTWTTKASLPVAGQDFSSGVLGNKLYVFGGLNEGEYYHSVYVYDPNVDSWTVASPMPTARRGAACGVINNVFYIAGGVNEHGILTVNESFESVFPVMEFSVRDNFSTVNGNPNGVWSYGWMPTDFSSFNLHDIHVDGPNSSWFGMGWWTVDKGNIWINEDSVTHYEVPSGWLSMHPGPGYEPAVIRWTAPFDASVHVSGVYLPGDLGVLKVNVRHNNSEIWSATDSGVFDLTEFVFDGEYIDFVVYDGYSYGNTPLAATITANASPGTWMTISGVSPVSGPTTGSTSLSINGTGFADGAIVYIDNNPATGISWQNPGLITATTPPGSAGPKDIKVINPDGQTTFLDNGYTYTPPTSLTGDVNIDGMVNVFDITKLVRIILNVDGTLPLADVNGDGMVNVVDITRVVLTILQLE